MGDRFFSKIQFGKETTKGTAVAATRILIGSQVSAISPDRRPRKIPENIGLRSAGSRRAIDQYLVSDSLNIAEGYFQCLPFVFGGGLKGGVTPTETTASQADYKWDFTPSLAFNASNAQDAFTLEKGDNTQAFECEYTMFQRIRIAGRVAQGAEGAPVAIDAEFFARQWTATTFTGALSLPTATSMNAKLSKLFVDTSWAALGTTEIANVLRSFDIDIMTGVHPKFTGSAAKTFNEHGEGLIGAQVALTLEGGSAADTIWDSYHSDTQALSFLQLLLSGPQIGTGVNHSLKVNVSGRWDEVIPLAEEDRGNNLHTLLFTSDYDATSAKEVGVEVVTNQNTY